MIKHTTRAHRGLALWLWAMACVLALSGCAAAPAPEPLPAPLNRVVEIDRLNPPDGVIVYISERGSPAYGPSVRSAVQVFAPEDVNRLRDAPADFKQFVAAQEAELIKRVTDGLAAQRKSVEGEGCEYVAQIRVWGLTDEVATGRIRGCKMESYDVIWQKVKDRWGVAARQQGGWDCSVLDRYQVPAEITAAVCWYDDGRKTRAYDGPA